MHHESLHMLKKYTSRSIVRRFTCLCMGIALLTGCSAWAAQTNNKKSAFENNDETFVFAGKCPNGGAYRLFSYRKDLNGLSRSYYDYEGPVGKGTVLSETPPKVMAARVCRELAEIINANYWE